MDEAELARQMEKAELENTEIGGKSLDRLKLICSILILLLIIFKIQVTMTNLTWKRRAQMKQQAVGRKQAKRERPKMRNRKIADYFFSFLVTWTRIFCGLLPSSELLQMEQPSLRKIMFSFST